jgi:hypothetical protein
MKTAPVGGQLVRRTGRNTVVAQLTVDSLRHLMPEVKPGAKIDSNREVSLKRCEALAEYYIEKSDRWILPPILVDTEYDLEFISQGTITVDNPTKDAPIPANEDWKQFAIIGVGGISGLLATIGIAKGASQMRKRRLVKKFALAELEKLS